MNTKSATDIARHLTTFYSKHKLGQNNQSINENRVGFEKIFSDLHGNYK